MIDTNLIKANSKDISERLKLRNYSFDEDLFEKIKDVSLNKEIDFKGKITLISPPTTLKFFFYYSLLYKPMPTATISVKLIIFSKSS